MNVFPYWKFCRKRIAESLYSKGLLLWNVSILVRTIIADILRSRSCATNVQLRHFDQIKNRSARQLGVFAASATWPVR
jgi:hypothetical protein